MYGPHKDIYENEYKNFHAFYMEQRRKFIKMNTKFMKFCVFIYGMI